MSSALTIIISRYLVLIVILVASLARPSPGTEANADLDSLVKEALAINPGLEATRNAAWAADQVPPRVGTLPDPIIGFDFSNLRIDDPSLTASPMSGIQLALKQNVPFLGKLGRRRNVAEAAAQTAWSTVSLQEADLVYRVKAAYWDYHFAYVAEEISRDNVQILNSLVDIANSRFAVGDAAQQDVLKAQVAYAQLRENLLVREQATVTAREYLNITIGRNPSTEIGRPCPPADSLPMINAKELVSGALENSPRLAVMENVTVETRERLREAQYDRWPDIQLASGYRFREDVAGDRTEGADMFFVSFGLKLPIFARTKQNKRVQESRFSHNEAERRLVDIRLLVRFDVRRLVDVIERMNRQEGIYRAEILLEARLALDASLAEYRVAQVEFISVLDNWQRLFDAQIVYQDILANRQTRLAELEAVIGRPLQ